MKTHILYTKYLLNINEENQLQPSFTAPSPFGDGDIQINPDGQFECRATGKKGGVAEFLQLLYPGITDQGAATISTMDSRVSSSQMLKAQDHLNSFRKDKDQVKVVASQLGLTEAEVTSIPVYSAHKSSQFRYLEAESPSGTPLTVSSFSVETPLRSLRGVARLPKTLTDRIWLVENPVLAHSISTIYGDSAICWPNQRDLKFYDYRTLFKDKELIILHGELNFTYEQSFYPFLHLVKDSVNSYSRVNYTALTSSSNFPAWIKLTRNQERLLDEAKKGRMLQPISKQVYKQYVMQNDILPINFAQSCARGHFYYGTACGRIAQSWPLDILAADMLETNMRVRVKKPEKLSESIHLTTDRVVTISESLPQLTPKNTFSALRGLIRDHIYIENSNIEALLSLWIMGTYVYSLFNAYPYLHIVAAAGSGKTTALELIESTAFNSIMASRITTARLMQEISDGQTTTCLDEFEKNSGSQGEANTEILNSGYKRNGKYFKMRGENTDALNLYSPKVFASVSEIKTDTLSSRAIPIKMTKKPNHYPLKDFLPDDFHTMRRINGIKNGGYTLGLYHHEHIQYLMSRLPRQISLPCGLTINGRNQELIMPLVVMAQLLDVNRKSGEESVETELYSAIEDIFFPDLGEEVERLKILANQLREWSENRDEITHVLKDTTCWVSNKMWDNSRLLTHFNSERKEMLDWLKGLHPDVKRSSVHIPGAGTESCIGFPQDLKINGNTFKDWFFGGESRAA
jgi:hypothetical protein